MLFNLPRLAALSVLVAPAFVSGLDTVQFANLLKTNLSSGAKVYFPSDANYSSEVTLRSSSFEQPTYLATVQPATTSDVQTIVRFHHSVQVMWLTAGMHLQVKLASQYNVPFLATGGGHAGTITEKALQGLQVDLKLFKSVTYNANESTITVGGGVVMKDTYPTIEAAGKELRTPFHIAMSKQY
jgi:FAD/FMN-containing dehydrogenase